MTQSEMFILGAGFLLGSYCTLMLDASIQKIKIPLHLYLVFGFVFTLSVLFAIATR